MNPITSYTGASEYLNKIFDLLNHRFFNDELPPLTITIQSVKGTYGHFSLRPDTWVSAEGNTHELNIAAGHLNRPIEQVAATLLHEMTHYEQTLTGIKGTSRGNSYHNKFFKEAAERRGLIVKHHPTYGWTITEPSEELIAFIRENGLIDIQINRNEEIYRPASGTNTPGGSKMTPPPMLPRKSSTRKYVCVCCGLIIRATKVVRVKCIDCDMPMVLDE